MLKRVMFVRRFALLVVSSLAMMVIPPARALSPKPDPVQFDVVVYGGTAAGIVAAVQTASMGKSVLVIEPTRHIGGLTTGGLGATDIGKQHAIGGLSREFYRRIATKYSDDRYWTFQRRSEYQYKGQSVRDPIPGLMWTFEPKVASEVLDDWIREHRIELWLQERIDLNRGVVKAGTRIVEIILESGKRVRGKMFIDATYEGDLMAKAGVSYAVGRESAAQYGESLNGIQPPRIYPHERKDEIDAYVVKGDPRSGLLPTVRAGIGPEGSADPGIMAFCFRMCLTNHPENRVPIEKPASYNERNYELLLRTIEAGRTSRFFGPTPMPNWKTDCNSTEPYSTNYVGMNHAYPDGDYATRERIIEEHKAYQLGFLWTLQNHPRVPESVRKEIGQWGLPKDEFVDTGHWSPQLYIREARRMVGEFVMTQAHCVSEAVAPEIVGLASYTLDSHYVQRFVDERGIVRHEGYFDRRIRHPYGISYRSLVPQPEECSNLLVPVCLSASHAAFGSIRMEPVFMVLGQSAATAACLAIDQGVPVQGLDYAALRERLLADKQILSP